MENKTAVDWLTERLTIDWRDPWNRDLLHQAKQMEKDQIIKAFDDGTEDENLIGIEYYNEKYKSFNSPQKTDNES